MKRLLGLATVLVLATGTGARAECYPPNPANGSGQVDRSRVAPGECVVFSGNGFRPRADVTVADDGVIVGTSKANPKGEFSHQVCFGSGARPGQHVLTGTGADKGGDCEPGNNQAMGGVGFRAMAVSAQPAERTVSATVYVLGAGEVAEPGGGNQGRDEGTGGSGGSGDSGGSGGGLPFTGDITLIEGTVGLALLLFGGAVLVAARPRRRTSSPA